MLHQNVGYSKMQNRSGNGDFFFRFHQNRSLNMLQSNYHPDTCLCRRSESWCLASGRWCWHSSPCPATAAGHCTATAWQQRGEEARARWEKDGGKNKTRGEASGGREVERDMRQYTGDEEDREGRGHRAKKEDNVRRKSWREKRRGRQTELTLVLHSSVVS